MFWSAVRYGAFSTDRKRDVDKNPLTYTTDGAKLDVYGEAQENFIASALRKRREQQEMHGTETSEAGQPAARKPFSKMDFTALVLSEGLETPAQLMTHVKSRASVDVQAFTIKHQSRLQAWLQEAWEWHGAEAKAKDERMTGWERVQEHAAKRCECEGDCVWAAKARDFFDRTAASRNLEQTVVVFANMFTDHLLSQPFRLLDATF